MRLIHAGVLLICLLAGAACDNSGPVAPDAASLNETFTMARGDVISLSGTDLRLQFLGVIGDSRCPMNAICIQAGDAIVQIGVTGHGTPQDYQLHSDPRFAAVTRGDLRIELVQLQPLPLSGTTLEQERYPSDVQGDAAVTPDISNRFTIRVACEEIVRSVRL